MLPVIESRGLNLATQADLFSSRHHWQVSCISFGMQVLAPHIKITMIPAPAPEAEQGAAATTARPRARPDQEELVPYLETFLKAHPEIKSQGKMAKVIKQE